MKSLRIGKLKLKNPLILSPMVDVTDLPYREICRREGAALAYTEMLYIDAILHENKKTLQLLEVGKKEKPIGIQITGNNEEEFEKFVKLPLLKKFDLIDVNCGCPSIRITGNEAGSFLLKNPKKIGRMIKILKKSGKIVTAKIRLGFKENNVLEVAREIERAGADALTVHGRLATQGGSVPANWKEIARVKKELKIPVIGNGDVFDGKSAAKLLEICDGVMIARGAIGDPAIFSRVLHFLKTGEEIEKDVKKNLELFVGYLELQKKYFGKNVDLGRVKYVGGNFLKGFNGASKAREKLMKCKSVDEVLEFARELKVV